MTKKGQNKSPVILTKIKALLFVQERSWNLLWRRRWSPQFISTIKLHPDVCLSVQLSASQLHHDPKFISKAQNPASIWTVTRLSFLRPSLGPDPLAEKHWRVLSSPGWRGGGNVNAAEETNVKSEHDDPVKCEEDTSAFYLQTSAD